MRKFTVRRPSRASAGRFGYAREILRTVPTPAFAVRHEGRGRASSHVRGALLTLALLLATALAVAGCGSGGATTTSHAAHARRSRATTAVKAAAPVHLAYHALYALPAAVRDAAFAPLSGGRFALLGGLTAADTSTAAIEVGDIHGILHTAALTAPQHDAEAATLGGNVYVFGGGVLTQFDHILRYEPTSGSVSQVGTLPVGQSDVGVAGASTTAYVVGGFDGTNYLNTVVAWRPGMAPAVEAHLPVGLRYPAVAVAGNGLYIMGGSDPSGASNAVYRFDLTTHQVRQIATLRHPVTHGMAATLGSTVYLIGGRGDLDTAQTADIWAINPATGRITGAGRLPTPTSDAAAMTVGGGIVIAGGQSPTTTLASVGELVPASR